MRLLLRLRHNCHDLAVGLISYFYSSSKCQSVDPFGIRFIGLAIYNPSTPKSSIGQGNKLKKKTHHPKFLFKIANKKKKTKDAGDLDFMALSKKNIFLRALFTISLHEPSLGVYLQINDNGIVFKYLLMQITCWHFPLALFRVRSTFKCILKIETAVN